MNKKVITTNGAPAPIGPYNQAILANNTLYMSGQIAIDPSTGELISGSIQDETHMVMKNIGSILREAGMDYDNVVKCSIFLSDMELFVDVNEVYGSYFNNAAPARETVEVACLPKKVNVEISVIAIQ